MKRYLAIFSLLFIGLAQVTWADEATLYLVRHAEKVEDSDPGLTEQGQARALALAALMKDKGIIKVFSTDYKRTRQTAAPTAAQSDLDISFYNPRAFQEFAAALKAEFLERRQSMLVVGHSNTTPYLATLLTGQEFPMLRENQYDHLYAVTVDENGNLTASISYFNP